MVVTKHNINKTLAQTVSIHFPAANGSKTAGMDNLHITCFRSPDSVTFHYHIIEENSVTVRMKYKSNDTYLNDIIILLSHFCAKKLIFVNLSKSPKIYSAQSWTCVKTFTCTNPT